MFDFPLTNTHFAELLLYIRHKAVEYDLSNIGKYYFAFTVLIPTQPLYYKIHAKQFCRKKNSINPFISFPMLF